MGPTQQQPKAHMKLTNEAKPKKKGGKKSGGGGGGGG